VSAAVVGLVVALPEECRTLTDRPVRPGDCLDVGSSRRVCVAGVGSDNARRAALRLIEDGARGLVSWGCAGSLSREVGAGALCLPEEILDTRGARLNAFPAWHRLARETLTHQFPSSTGPLLTAEHVVATTADKQRLAAQFRAVAVDMERAAVAAVAHECNVPFLAVRAIADPVDMSLPTAVVRATDANGVVHSSVVARHALLHPHDIPGLLRLASPFCAALRTLRGAAHRMGVSLLLDRATAG